MSFRSSGLKQQRELLHRLRVCLRIMLVILAQLVLACSILGGIFIFSAWWIVLYCLASVACIVGGWLAGHWISPLTSIVAVIFHGVHLGFNVDYWRLLHSPFVYYVPSGTRTVAIASLSMASIGCILTVAVLGLAVACWLGRSHLTDSQTGVGRALQHTAAVPGFTEEIELSSEDSEEEEDRVVEGTVRLA